MNRKRKPTLDPHVEEEICRIPMTNEALEKMSLNPYDQLFICRLMTMRDDATKEELAEIVLAQNRKMFKALDEQTDLIKGIATDILVIKKDLATVKTKQEEDERVMLEFDKRLSAKRLRLDKLEKEIHSLKKRLGVIEEQVKLINNGSSDAS